MFVATIFLLWQRCVCHDKTHLLSQQKYASHDKNYVLSQQAYFCHNKRCVLSWQKRVCCGKSKLVVAKLFCNKHNFVAINCFVTTKVLLQQAYFNHNKRCVLSWQTCVCHNKTFVTTKIIFVAVPTNDSLCPGLYVQVKFFVCFVTFTSNTNSVQS